jgi:probable HAF family extracellular repeat protein
MFKRILNQTILAGVLLVMYSESLGQAGITMLVPEAEADQSEATAVSGDGTVVMGYCVHTTGPNSFFTRAVRWVAGGGPEDMGTFSYVGVIAYSPEAMSVNGNAMVGGATWRSGPGASGYHYAAFRWNSSTGFDHLDALNGQRITDVYAYGVSGDGSVTVGASGTAPVAGSPTLAVLWHGTAGPQNLGTLPGMAYSTARAVSSDATVIVGWSGNDRNSERAFRASDATGEWLLQSLGVLPGAMSSEAIGVSGDGLVIVGGSSFGDWTQFNRHAFRWTADGGMEDLGTLPNSSSATALATNWNGSEVVGSLTGTAFLWTRDLGMVDLNSFLPGFGIDLSGWVLEYPTAISSDGSVIAGWGTLNGVYRGWVVHLPPLCGSADFNHDGVPGTDADIEAFFACIAGECCPRCGTADFDGDHDYATDRDIEAFFRVLAGGNC